MSAFADTLSDLVAKEAFAAQNDPERLGDMIEAVARALGTSIAFGARGNTGLIDTLMTGAEAYAHEEAVSKAAAIGKLTSLMSKILRGRP